MPPNINFKKGDFLLDKMSTLPYFNGSFSITKFLAKLNRRILTVAMKKLLVVLLLLMGVNASAQYWPIHEFGGQWIRTKINPNTEPGVYSWEISGGVSMAELNDVGLSDMGSGRSDYGYFEFFGEKENSLAGPVFDWPPSFMDHNYSITYPRPNRFIAPQSFENGFCNCDCIEPTPDTLYPADGFGFCLNDPHAPWNLWGINSGYLVYTSHMQPWMKLPCPPTNGFWKGYDPLYFTDSTYTPLPANAVLSGDSRLYLKAITQPGHPEVLDAIVYRTANRNDSVVVHMDYDEILREWHGTIQNSHLLKLKSYGTLVAETKYPTDSTLWDKNHVDVALPKIYLQIDSVFTDTVFIRSDSMKVAKDPKVSLRFYKDDGGAYMDARTMVDSAGYKYKSRWTANSAFASSKIHKHYFRQFPANNSTYRRWNKLADSCIVLFSHDSLYAIGGDLTIECKGALDSLKDIDNRFRVVTDTLAANQTDTLQTKRILINRDPTNSLFETELYRDRIRGVAWQEYAGSEDKSHCYDSLGAHNIKYNPPWNHYWDDLIKANHDTCRDSKTPCENTGWTDTGVMQIIRIYDTSSTSGWESWFSRGGNLPGDYTVVSWDSLAWNWKINCFNGRYIHDKYMPFKFMAEQNLFPDSCSFADCDTFPTTKNKEDLKSYGYHRGENYMKLITTDKKWKECISDIVHHYEYSIYVQDVRKYTYRRPWQ